MQDDHRDAAITAKRQSKDSVFVKLFEDKNAILRLYRELHPEHTDVTIDDITVQTLEAVLVNTLYNDLGFIVKDKDKDRFVLLIEAQSTWNPNMTLRMLMYLGGTIRQYLRITKQSLHLSKRVHIPQPELFVVYTGSRDVPDVVSLNEDYFSGQLSDLDLRIRILKQTDTATLHGQYIGFCKVFDEQRKIHKDDVKCIEETIRICLERGYLTDFLVQHKEEVFTMMSELFDEEYQREEYEVALRSEIETDRSIRFAMKLLARGRESVEEIAEDSGLPIERVRELAAQLASTKA